MEGSKFFFSACGPPTYPTPSPAFWCRNPLGAPFLATLHRRYMYKTLSPTYQSDTTTLPSQCPFPVALTHWLYHSRCWCENCRSLSPTFLSLLLSPLELELPPTNLTAPTEPKPGFLVHPIHTCRLSLVVKLITTPTNSRGPSAGVQTPGTQSKLLFSSTQRSRGTISAPTSSTRCGWVARSVLGFQGRTKRQVIPWLLVGLHVAGIEFFHCSYEHCLWLLYYAVQKMRVCNGFCAHKHILKLKVCYAVTRWVVLPTKCTRRYGGRSAVCFHTPTVRRANHHDGWERDWAIMPCLEPPKKIQKFNSWKEKY